MSSLGKSLIVLGLIVAAAGVIVSLTPKIPWLGHLPGDIFVRKEKYTLYFPLATCLLLSAIVSLSLWLLRR
jgi:Protein of unknown function (DUF2905)